MSESQEIQTRRASEDAPAVEGLPDEYLDPYKWLFTLDLGNEMVIRPSASLHADYREAVCKCTAAPSIPTDL
jgi:hypothetical protein